MCLKKKKPQEQEKNVFITHREIRMIKSIKLQSETVYAQTSFDDGRNVQYPTLIYTGENEEKFVVQIVDKLSDGSEKLHNPLSTKDQEAAECVFDILVENKGVEYITNTIKSEIVKLND